MTNKKDIQEVNEIRFGNVQCHRVHALPAVGFDVVSEPDVQGTAEPHSRTRVRGIVEGTRLKDLLNAAGVKAEGKEVVFFGADR